MRHFAYAAAKRAVDVTLAVALLVVIAPLALVALSPARLGALPRFRPVRCIGKHGRPFTLHEEALADTRQGIARAIARSWLRRWPVLLSIVVGDLSFVGPRALPVAEAGELPEDARDRLAAVPGLFCYWWLQQRANIDFDCEGDADRRYLRDRSLRTDLAILLRAIIALPYGRPDAKPLAVVHVAGIRLLNLGLDELVAAIGAAVASRARTQIAFVNPACVNIAATDPIYRSALARADWVCPDGIGMKIAGRILGRPIRQNLNGTDLFPRLCAAAADGGHRIFLLGARAGVAAAAARWAEREFPRLQIVGALSGYFDGDGEDGALAAIRASGADILLVAMGVPQQDVWLRHNLRRSGATVGIGVGGLFDFYSGRIPRAPLWLREVGGEWIYRLLQEPRRMWRRYLVGNAVFLWRIVRERLAMNAVPGNR